VSFPLSWGATRRAAIEADRTFMTDRSRGSPAASASRSARTRIFLVDDRRTEVKARGERRVFNMLTFGGELGRTRLTFKPVQENFWTTGADVTLDTRRDPSFPSDAILTSVTWSRLHPLGSTAFG